MMTFANTFNAGEVLHIWKLEWKTSYVLVFIAEPIPLRGSRVLRNQPLPGKLLLSFALGLHAHPHGEPILPHLATIPSLRYTAWLDPVLGQLPWGEPANCRRGRFGHRTIEQSRLRHG